MCDPTTITWTEAAIHVAVVLGAWESAKFLLNRFARWIEGGARD